MTPRSVETFIARFTLALLLVYAPLETWASWPSGLTNPFYLVDVVGFALLLWGALASLRARPGVAPGVLCAGYAWSGANGWAGPWRSAWRRCSRGVRSMSRWSGCSSSERS